MVRVGEFEDTFEIVRTYNSVEEAKKYVMRVLTNYYQETKQEMPGERWTHDQPKLSTYEDDPDQSTPFTRIFPETLFYWIDPAGSDFTTGMAIVKTQP